MVINGIDISDDFIKQEVRKYSISELAVFGSILTDEFSPQSDVDLLVTFKEDADVGLFDLMSMRREFSEYLHRDVDIVEKAAIKNPYRRKNILSTYRVLYAA